MDEIEIKHNFRYSNPITMSNDPFEPVSSSQESQFDDLYEVTREYEEATKAQRFVNYLVDTVVVIILSIFVGFFFGWASGPEDEAEAMLNILFLGIWVLYYTLFEKLTGKSLGKLITRTRVLTTEDHELTWGHAIGRSLCRFIPFDALSFLFGHNGWHDSISQTRVVKDVNT